MASKRGLMNVRLYAAALNARDEMRDLLGRLDHAIRNPGDQAAFLCDARSLIEHHAIALTLGLKFPAGNSRHAIRKNPYSGTPWGLSEPHQAAQMMSGDGR